MTSSDYDFTNYERKAEVKSSYKNNFQYLTTVTKFRTDKAVLNVCDLKV